MRNAISAALLRGVAIFFLFSPVISLSVYSQPQLDFKRITERQGRIELSFQVECAGQQQRTLSGQNFIVLDNGNSIDAFTLSCPDPACDELHIMLRSRVGEQVRIVLTDVLGKSTVVYSGRAGEAAVAMRISLLDRARGPLFIHAQAGERRITRKVMRY
jgi:hypothetical protein